MNAKSQLWKSHKLLLGDIDIVISQGKQISAFFLYVHCDFRDNCKVKVEDFINSCRTSHQKLEHFFGQCAI